MPVKELESGVLALLLFFFSKGRDRFRGTKLELLKNYLKTEGCFLIAADVVIVEPMLARGAGCIVMWNIPFFLLLQQITTDLLSD